MRLTGSRIPRLVSDERPRPDARAESVYRKAVAHEMLQARESARGRALDPFDTRWQFATAIEQSLQGATLPYEDRQRLLGLATKLGIREFDAHLIVALVQDRARRGETLESVAPTIALLPLQPTAASGNASRRLTTHTDRSTAMAAEIRRASSGAPTAVALSPLETSEARSSATPWVIAMIAAIAIDAALIAWLMFG